MTVLTNETKTRIMRDAFATLAMDYMKENNYRKAQKVIDAASALCEPFSTTIGKNVAPEIVSYEDTWVRLYDIIVKA
jgi:hypothetical protein